MTMKTFALLSALAASTLSLSAAQTVSVNTPRAGDTLTAGGTFTVEVQQARVGGIVDEISLTIGITPCPSGACSPSIALGPGTTLYNGAFTPTQTTNGLIQDFSLTLPASVPSGESVLTVFHVADTQAPGGPFVPVFDYTNVVITVA